MIVHGSNLSGNMLGGDNNNPQATIEFMQQLEALMAKYSIDKVDMCWSRNALLKNLRKAGGN